MTPHQVQENSCSSKVGVQLVATPRVVQNLAGCGGPGADLSARDGRGGPVKFFRTAPLAGESVRGWCGLPWEYARVAQRWCRGAPPTSLREGLNSRSRRLK